MSTFQEVMNKHHPVLKSCIDEYVPLLLEARKANDPLPHAVQMGELLKHLSSIAKDYADATRRFSIQDMQETGQYNAECGPYIVTLRKGSERAVVRNAEALRTQAPELFKPQPDKVDTKELGQRLKFQHMEGAELVEGEPTIMVRGKK